MLICVSANESQAIMEQFDQILTQKGKKLIISQKGKRSRSIKSPNALFWVRLHFDEWSGRMGSSIAWFST